MQPSCPQCGHDYVRWVHREGPFEQLVSVFKIFPFRCQLCTYRFRAFQWRSGYSQDLIDRRENERLPCNIAVGFSLDNERWEGLVTDIAMGGCALKTDVRVPLGSRLTLKLQLFSSESPVTIEVAMVRSLRPNSMGLQFMRIKPTEKDRLSRFVARMVGVSWGGSPAKNS